LDLESLRRFRDRFGLPISDEELPNVPFYKPSDDSPEMQYMHKRRQALGGYLPERIAEFESVQTPSLDAMAGQLKGTGDREISTTMSFVRTLSTLTKDKTIGKSVVPIVPDEARTFGMEGLFRQLGIYSSQGQKYTPHDRDQIMYYKEAKDGQIMEEGINESGAFSAWLACATSYSNHKLPLIPFYIFYSMFGFQRVMDLTWAAGDSQARGFLIGATAGRTTLNGEGLQHQDGHSHLMANMIPNCVSYDPTYNFELTVILQNGMERMYNKRENIFYYITVMNENYSHPDMPEGAAEGIVKGMYLLKEGPKGKKGQPRVQLMGSGTILREVEAAAEILAGYGVNADIWSATSINELTREAQDCDRWNMYHMDETPRVPYVTQLLEGRAGPVISATDYMKAYSEQLRPFIKQRFVTLGTDGYGRSDTRSALRHHFEVDSKYVAFAALRALFDEGEIKADVVKQAMQDLDIDPNKPNPQYS
jgi:pyruvate dehydrogenase E1 component